MKKIFYAMALLLGIVSCGKQDRPEAGVQPEQTGAAFPAEFVGTVSVLYNGENVDNEGIRILVREGASEGVVDIDMFQVQFVPVMPMIDLTIPDITVQEQPDGTLTLAVEDVDPLYLGQPMSRYHVSDFQGQSDGQALHFGSFPTLFSGTKN